MQTVVKKKKKSVEDFGVENLRFILRNTQMEEILFSTFHIS